MCWIKDYLKSSIGKKQILAVSGLLLCGFLFTHLLGNLIIYLGPEAYNSYSHKLMANPLIIPAEIGLLLLILLHMGLAIRIVVENRLARPERYRMYVPTGRGATFASRTMPLTGIIALVFITVHIIQFRFGHAPPVVYEGVAMRDLYTLVVQHFQSVFWVVWYLVAQVALGIHLSHGFSSAFGTLGLHHPKYSPMIKKLGYAFAVLIAGGLSTIPLWAFFVGGHTL